MFVTTIFAGAFAFGVGFDVAVTKFYDSWNKGVRHIGSFYLRSIDPNFRNNGKILDIIT